MNRNRGQGRSPGSHCTCKQAHLEVHVLQRTAREENKGQGHDPSRGAWRGAWLTSCSRSACSTAFSTVFLDVSCASPPSRNSSRMKYAFSKLNMMSSSHTCCVTNNRAAGECRDARFSQ
ncbi:hypothetical protein EYF80_065125 [Liparis tanakae]|uniref:Uncharacterized protein n=1 Tax=Liparis tanakae TaxID=230148 RepID=A0A4Z2E7I7_9TELE|nr:hypothetical protein EYF80_065125 [Liparis tanakae]